MKKLYASLLFIAASLLARPTQAQYYTFNDAAGGLSSYKQDFNTLSGNVALTSNHLNSPSEVYAEAEFPGYPAPNNYYAPGTISANDGSNATGNYYHFGYASGAGASDRSFGGIAALSTANGIGYAGIRFKNASSVTIQNLEVQYAMEQWYNSGRQDAAQVDVSYLAGSSVTSLLQATGTWVSVPALQVKAPSTTTKALTSRDGNSAANRRLVSTTIMGINLAPGQEVMIRWAYALNSTTNGNGLSIDDVVVTPETGIFYSKTTGDLSALGTWGQNMDGTGTAPGSFTTDNQIFYVMSASPGTNPAYVAAPSSNATADRIGATASPTTASWTVSGANSKIVVGTASAPATLLVDYTKNIAGVIDVSPGSLFVTRRTLANGPIGFTLGTLASTSTVEYNSGSTSHSIQPNQYSNLKVTGSGSNPSTNPKNLFNSTIVTGILMVGGGSNLVLGDYDLTVISSGSITGSATGYVVTSGKGRLRMLVPRASSTALGTQVAFPVGSSFTSYTPVTLQQTTSNSDDVFEVRVIDNVYSSYDASYTPNGPAITNQVVNKTWLVSKEVPANAANVTMTTQWNMSENSGNFKTATAHINHYTGGAWDSYNTEVGVTGPNAGPFVVKRSNITSFSPFGVSSQPAGPLPVVLTSFGAQRSGAAVRCAWTTASEVNSRGFDVERSLDGHTFATLGMVAAAGTAATTRAYTFLDAHAPTTTAYYRLRQLDLNGTASYSPVVSVEALAGGTSATGVAVPNPTTGLVTIWAGANVTQAEVLTVLGASVLRQQLAEPTPQVALDLSSLPAGVYLVRLATANGPQVVRVNKQ
ncbi:T9SS type A sorting domain-containing protein [Hymenobacter psoromatis]|uniref:T9SS type A sorting domain-containing protein n=1 Tax=Hymenobacter psoromatis TaxID=1484116 RepID=UPI001CC03FCF